MHVMKLKHTVEGDIIYGKHKAITSALDVAAYFLELSRWRITNLHLQRYLYVAQMLFFSEGDDPLFYEDFEAGDYGPTIPHLFNRFKKYGGVNPITERISYNLSEEHKEYIKEIYDLIKDKTPVQLIAMTHRKDGSWDKNYLPGKDGIYIPKDDIRDELHLRKDQTKDIEVTEKEGVVLQA